MGYTDVDNLTEAPLLRKLIELMEKKIGMGTADYEVITVSDSVTSLSSKKAGAVRVFITLEDGEIRFRVDGGDPTSANGHVAQAGQSIDLISPYEIENFKAIRTGADSGTMRVTYQY